MGHHGLQTFELSQDGTYESTSTTLGGFIVAGD